jgi:hypothetical protein
MGATEERRRHPFWQRPKTRRLLRLAWPALGVWVVALLHELFYPREFSSLSAAALWVWLGILGALVFFFMLAFAYVFVAAAAKAPTKVRLLACAANLSTPILAFLLLWPSAEPEQIAEVECKQLHDKAMLWKTIHRKPSDSLDEMVAPLRPENGENFLEAVPDDPWGRPYLLKREGTKIRVYSWGEDGKEGTDDDIVYPAE